MKDREYLKKQIALTEELERAASAEPYDEDIYNDVINRINALHTCWYQGRRRRPWFALAICIFLVIVLLWICYKVLSML